MMKVFTVAEALANTSLLVVCNKTEKIILTEKQNAIRNVTNKVDLLMARAQTFLGINMSTDEILSVNENITDAAQVVKDKIEATLDNVQKNQTNLQKFSGALHSLRSWFFCFVGSQDNCNSENTTTVCKTTTASTDNIETSTTPSTKPNLTELKSLIDSAAKTKGISKENILKAQSRKGDLKIIKAALYQLQSDFLLSSKKLSQSGSQRGFTLSTQLATLTALPLDNNSDCTDSCEKLIICFSNISNLIKNDEEKLALALAEDLEPDISHPNCTLKDKQQISKHISDATDAASKIGDTLSSEINEEVSKLISALGSILAANEDLVELGKSKNRPSGPSGLMLSISRFVQTSVCLCVCLFTF